jgi:hypothetical protein
VSRAIRRRRHPERTPKARRERADATQADGEADVGDRAVGVAEQRGRSLETTGQEVFVGRLAERSPELAAEVGTRQVRDARKVSNVERVAVARIDEVLRPEEMPQRVDGSHPRLT